MTDRSTTRAPARLCRGPLGSASDQWSRTGRVSAMAGAPNKANFRLEARDRRPERVFLRPTAAKRKAVTPNKANSPRPCMAGKSETRSSKPETNPESKCLKQVSPGWDTHQTKPISGWRRETAGQSGSAYSLPPPSGRPSRQTKPIAAPRDGGHGPPYRVAESRRRQTNPICAFLAGKWGPIAQTHPIATQTGRRRGGLGSSHERETRRAKQSQSRPRGPRHRLWIEDY